MEDKKIYQLPPKVLELLPLQYRKFEQVPPTKKSKRTIKHSTPSKFLNTQEMAILHLYKPISKIL